MTQCDIPALVLAGGKSTRLGLDKVGLHFSGKTMLSRMIELAGSLCREVCVSGRDPAELGVCAPWLPDDTAGVGPMGGILTGLRAFGRPLLVLACDLPMLDAPTVARLLAAEAQRPPHAVMTTFRQEETGYIESLVSVYTPQAIPLLEQAMRDGIYKLSRAIPPELRHHVPYSRSEAAVFFNINFPADLAMLRQVENHRLPS
ncbi:molybdopterin-guanine dinucleotide biosynthesis protein A [Desulfobaculum xiamenense]|uniref:Probable molybdenum cofactor guanylyltransferase n=1 Tax=Desulfobaculum xiamenense TaxID=995050 RepID=A0A846QLR6_9BACT|nr:molybdenum cofactor guanylyltransferase [Desulfobaculum xiamenense]NJB66385.1 molybdopterin-guanine dinucleotide biosynthesis protein A [Desulfobaculum xiamenense]